MYSIYEMLCIHIHVMNRCNRRNVVLDHVGGSTSLGGNQLESMYSYLNMYV